MHSEVLITTHLEVADREQVEFSFQKRKWKRVSAVLSLFAAVTTKNRPQGKACSPIPQVK